MEEAKPRRAPREKAAGGPASVKASAPAKAKAKAAAKPDAKAATPRAPAGTRAKSPTASPAPSPAKPASERPALDPELRARMVETAAYYRAERRGFAPGYEVEDWFAAEVEIEALVGGHSGPARSSSAARRKG